MLTFGSWICLLAGIVTAIAIAIDVSKRPQPMKVMNVTWPITGLYMPVIGWFAYRRMGRAPLVSAQASHSHGGAQHEGHGGHEGHQPHGGDKPKWQSVFVSATHCGGGCTLGDIIASPLATLTGFALLGSSVVGHFALAFVCAYLFGVLFQYLPIRAMSDAGRGEALKNAIKADTLSLIAFQTGMYLWMLIALQLWLAEITAFSVSFWFMMQIAMLVGFVTSYRANWLLIDRGIKHGM
ncbi:DUF4396 domain-containing protein [Salinicola aestuarinus]|uniref:DUF4396 domain-containing protein n=1 Tax=Salinicola aestuarinus TaxID=1949082 RepID=UPI000DA19256|nr:DUF4396 domain-containing protein [Salinicola aestuarinus]